MADTPQNEKKPAEPLIYMPSQESDEVPRIQNAQTSQDEATNLGPVPILRRHAQRRPAKSESPATSLSVGSSGQPALQVRPLAPPLAPAPKKAPQNAPSFRPMGAFEQTWRETHEWMHDRLEDANSWLNWLTLYFPVIAIQITPTHAVWISDADVLEHAYDNLMMMLSDNGLIAENSKLFPIDYTFEDMMGPPTYNSDTRLACAMWTRIMGPLRSLQAMTVENAVLIEATLATNVANGHHVPEHEEDDEEEEPEIIPPPARRPRGKQQAIPRGKRRVQLPDEVDEEDDDTD